MSTPEKWMSMSSPIITSSISLQWPSFTSSGWSKVDAISPPAHSNNKQLKPAQWVTMGYSYHSSAFVYLWRGPSAPLLRNQRVRWPSLQRRQTAAQGSYRSAAWGSTTTQHMSDKHKHTRICSWINQPFWMKRSSKWFNDPFINTAAASEITYFRFYILGDSRKTLKTSNVENLKKCLHQQISFWH